jgi:hypothetical protein
MKVPKILFKKKIPQSGIYCIENTKNGKIYIGSSKNMYQRLHVHRIYLNNKVHQNQKLQNSWNKHTENSFICYSLEMCSHNDLTKKEQYWIDLLSPWYNITLKVERNILSEESKIKISETLKRKYKSGEIKATRTSEIDCYDLEGNFIKSYKMLKDCSKDLNIATSSITRIIAGEYKQCKGYQFKYKNDNKILGKVEIDIAGRSKRSVPLKSDKLLENPEEDNQQPIITLNE